MKNLALTAVGPSELDDAADAFLKAFEVTEQSKASTLKDFWRLLYHGKHAHFVAARLGSETVGCGGMVTYERSAWVAFMGVLPSMQRKQIGDTILKWLLDYARSLNINTLRLDATNFGHGLYARHGFIDEYAAHSYEIIKPPGSKEAGDPDCTVTDDLPEWCLRMDSEAFGDDRSGLLKSVIGAGAKAVICGEQGYGLILRDQVGPVIAQSLGPGHAILRQAYRMGARKIYIPLHAGLPRDFLRGMKMVEPTTSRKCCQRMILGDPLKEDTTKHFASFSAATG
jgi:GNAT superfamily N-acetyltransferase